MTRDEALAIVQEHIHNPALLRHMLAVEASMVVYAAIFGEADQEWRLAGLLHDFDWEIHNTLERHPQDGAPILRARGVPESVVRCILSHADHTGVSRQTHMERSLFACDELTGLITAVALVKPSKSLAEVDAPSVRKKMKDKAFARSVNRDDIVSGAAALGVDLDEHVAFVIEAMKPAAGELGLAG